MVVWKKNLFTTLSSGNLLKGNRRNCMVSYSQLFLELDKTHTCNLQY